jgi:CubicO group peptidase (beta-lactamase class C family)
MKELPKTGPCDAGIREEALLRFLDAAEDRKLGLHSFQLVRHGAVAAEAYWAPFRPESPHVLYSLSKSFTATAIGFAVQEGLLSLEDRVASFFPEKLPAEPCANMREMRVRHLLTMSTGHAQEPGVAFAGDDRVATFLRSYVDLAPGSRFVYNTPATYMLSAILQKTAGVPLPDYLAPRLFEPLGIEGATWETCPQGIAAGGYGLMVRTGDIARFGQFLLQRGQWDGRRLLDPAWIDAATAKQVENGSEPDNDWSRGYGYQFWRCVPDGVYRGDGAFGQLCVVMPRQDAVFAATAATDDMQAVLKAVWEILLPALGEPCGSDPDAARQLSARLAGLSLPTPAGDAAVPMAAQVSGRTYRLGENAFGATGISFRFGEDGAVSFRTKSGGFTLPVGHGSWRDGRIDVPEARDDIGAQYRPDVSCAGAWTSGDTYELAICYNRSPTLDRLVFRFESHGVVVGFERTHDFRGTREEWTGLLQDA